MAVPLNENAILNKPGEKGEHLSKNSSSEQSHLFSLDESSSASPGKHQKIISNSTDSSKAPLKKDSQKF